MAELKINIPQSWNDLSNRQLLQLSLLLYTEKPGILFDVAILKILIEKYGPKKIQQILKEVPLSQLKPFYGYIYKQDNRTRFIRTMNAGGKVLHAPMDKLLNLTIKEFAAAEDLHMMWHQKRDREALEYLAAILYTTSPDVRPEYHLSQLNAKAHGFKYVPLAELLAMERAYAGCKNHITEKFKGAFTGGKARSGKKYGFGKVILEMSGGKFGTHKETQATLIHDFLEDFESTIVKAKTAKK